MTRHELDDRLAAHCKLMASIAIETDAGEVVPCVAGLLWTSESPADQEAAAHRCRACHLIEECRRYVIEFPEVSGVWAAMTPKEQARLHKGATS